MSAIPEFSRAAVLRKFKDPLKIEEVPVPKHIEPRAALVKMEACSICGTDVHLWQGSLSLKVDLPVIIGHEMVGRIVSLGEGVRDDSVGQALKVGDRIVYTHTSCGSCFFCTTARQPTLCSHRRAYMYETMEKSPYLLGGFSEYGYVLPESGRLKVPDSVSSELASLSSCALRSVMNAMSQIGKIEPYETVVIQGAGPLGLLATANAKVRGARKVIVIGSPAARLEMAREFGADECIPVEGTTAQERLDRVLALTEGRGADIVMEFTGVPAAFNEGLQLARKGAKYLIVGQLGEGKTEMQPSMIVKKNINVIGSFSGDARSYSLALQFIDKHQANFPFEKMITGRYKLDDVNLAMERMKSYQEIKPVISF
ncbi:MAG: zinc-binding dehydrogenase [Pollutimonas bauzanensis]|uniref:Threonine dehydrogenase n=1 Tax=Pollutimonas bauzanensis TaxID=658167 RepID=A0A1M5ZTH2_9BURK|nr:zinc-binding dehydrogenase [Pollutimonas bauzanensis]SHI27567.1 Threonine dehydrogenase [Pollutimonas bauzanensis]